MILILALLIGLLVFGFLIWWLIFETEGVYLGKRVVIALYDLYAARYDRIKQFDDYADSVLISQPVMSAIEPMTDPLILDVATGTGRVPLIMARNPRFDGHVMGLDASRKMLEVARQKMAAKHFEQFITLLHHTAEELPFPDGSFDILTCLEALEFMPNPETALREMIRVLRPGGLLLTTVRIDTRWMPNRTFSESKMRALLESQNMCDIQFKIWQEDYSQVWANKAGDSKAVGAGELNNVLTRLGEVPII